MRTVISALVLLLLCGCVRERIYNDMHGFADDNKNLYNSDMIQCNQEAYSLFPPQESPELVEIPPMPEAFSVGLAMAYGQRLAEIDAHNNRLMAEYREYTNTRTAYRNECMSGRGWRIVTVEE